MSLNLLRPKLKVGVKTWLAFTIVFWTPFLFQVAIQFYLMKDLLHDEVLNTTKSHLHGVLEIYNERPKTLQGTLDYIGARKEIGYAFATGNQQNLQTVFLELSKNKPHVSLILAVDLNSHVIARRSNGRGDTFKVGSVLANALSTGKSQVSTELISKEILLSEGGGAEQLINDYSVVQVVISPVKYNNKIVGAFIGGIVLTGDPWIGNMVYNRIGVEMAVFAGSFIENSFLHTTASLPRNLWKTGQPLPRILGSTISLGKPYVSGIILDNAKNFVAFEPIKDSQSRIIGTIGVSVPATHINLLVLQKIGIGALFAAILGFVVAMVITIIVYLDITRPIKFLIEAMENFGKGEVDKIEIKTGDEFEQLGTGFNTMSAAITKREERLRKHYEVAKLLMSTLDLNELLEKMLKIAVEVTDSQMGIVYLYDESSSNYIPQVQFGMKVDLSTLGMNEGYPGLVTREKQYRIITPDIKGGELKIELGFTSVIPQEVAYIPLIFQENIRGVLVLGSVASYTEEEHILFTYLANQISVALDNAIMHQRVQELSVKDTLTGLSNRRYLSSNLEKKWSACVRNKAPISILLADIDNFKSINDQYGHDKGDEVLKVIAEIFQRNIRNEDLAARYGGEEFVVVLDNTPPEGAVQLAERIGDDIRKHVFPWLNRQVTASIGAASYPELDTDNYESIIQAADIAMYKAKTTGKDKVILYNPHLEDE